MKSHRMIGEQSFQQPHNKKSVSLLKQIFKTISTAMKHFVWLQQLCRSHPYFVVVAVTVHIQCHTSKHIVCVLCGTVRQWHKTNKYQIYVAYEWGITRCVLELCQFSVGEWMEISWLSSEFSGTDFYGISICQ